MCAASQFDHSWNNFLRKFKFKKSLFQNFTDKEKLEICKEAVKTEDSRNYEIRMLEEDEVGEVKLYDVEHTSEEYWMSNYEDKYQISAFSCPTDPQIFIGEGPVRVTTGKQVIFVVYQEYFVSSTAPPTTREELY